MKTKTATIIFIVIAVAAAALLLVLNRPETDNLDFLDSLGGAATTTAGVSDGTYANDDYGISFAVPAGYRIDEKDTGSAQRTRHTITLMTEADFEAMNGPADARPGENPPAITIDFFQNDLDGQQLAEWVAGSNESNYKLPPDEPYASTTIDGVQALRYPWSGLYEGESVVWRHNGFIVMASVSYASPDDALRNDFEKILSTMKFSNPKPLTEQAALGVIKERYPELADFPSNSLPPKTVSSVRRSGSWYFSFQTDGSGVPFILEAVCYGISDSKEITKVGNYAHDMSTTTGTSTENVERIDPETCTPQE